MIIVESSGIVFTATRRFREVDARRDIKSYVRLKITAILNRHLCKFAET